MVLPQAEHVAATPRAAFFPPLTSSSPSPSLASTTPTINSPAVTDRHDEVRRGPAARARRRQRRVSRAQAPRGGGVALLLERLGVIIGALCCRGRGECLPQRAGPRGEPRHARRPRAARDQQSSCLSRRRRLSRSRRWGVWGRPGAAAGPALWGGRGHGGSRTTPTPPWRAIKGADASRPPAHRPRRCLTTFASRTPCSPTLSKSWAPPASCRPACPRA